MATETPRFFESAKLAWSDIARVVTDMPTLTAAAIVLGLVYGGLEIAMGDNWSANRFASVDRLTFSVLIGVAWTFLMTPLYLAIHRYIILGEVAPGYSIAFDEARFQRFFLYSLALYAVFLAPTTLLLLSNHSSLAVGFSVIFMLVGTYVIVRLTILFPAIAVDATGTSPRNAFDDTHGCFWRIFGIILLTSAPLIIGELLLFFALGRFSPIAKLANAVAGMLNMALMIAVASRLYLRLGDRLGRPEPRSLRFSIN